jgi:hypothetical protein
VVHACNLATWKAEIRRIEFEARLGKQFLRPYLENTQHKKRTGGVVQVVESRKSEALISNPSPLKKKKKKKTMQIYKGKSCIGNGRFCP